MVRLFAAALFLAGCQFTVNGLPADSAGGGGGGSVQDLSTGGSGNDDLAMSDGLPSMFDLAPPFTPSHVAPADLTLGTGDVTATSTIHTDPTDLTVDGAAVGGGALFFVESGKYAVLAVRSFVVPGGNTVRVTGALPLVIVASQTIVISGTLDAGGKTITPGPGGGAPGLGPSPGVAGNKKSNGDSGGSGGGYGGKGGDSGDDDNCGGQTANGVNGASTAGDAKLTMLIGGSGGGKGSPGGCPVAGVAVGGAGGGAVQLTAALSIIVNGTVNVGGGGGSGGCKDASATDSGSGAGGGSGGALLLEAPMVTVSGTLGGNGGGGGGGAYLTVGGVGGDGTAAPGSAGAAGKDMTSGGAEVTVDRGGAGSGGSSMDDSNCGNTGGGGGGTGRIFLHTRDPANTSGSTISPAATTQTNL